MSGGVHPKTETEKMVTVLEKETLATRESKAARVRNGLEAGSSTTSFAGERVSAVVQVALYLGYLIDPAFELTPG